MIACQRYQAAFFVFAMILAASIFSITRNMKPEKDVFRGGFQAVVIYDDYQIADQLAWALKRNPNATREDFDVPIGWQPPSDWVAPEDFTPPDWWHD